MKLRIYDSGKGVPVKMVRVRKIVEAVISSERRSFRSVSVIIGDDRCMKRLNRIFFKKNRPTNVISFNIDGECEIYIARKRSRKELDAYYYIVHGLLHAVGYDHLNRRDSLAMDRKCWEYLGPADHF